MTDNFQDAVLREKILYQYTSAVERGDFETVTSILAQAESDPQLEQMIVEINGALTAELSPAPGMPARPRFTVWQRIQAVLRTFAPGVGLSTVIIMLVIVGLSLLGPAIGNTFDNVMLYAPTSDESQLRQAYFATLAPYPPGSAHSETYPAFEPTATSYFSQPTMSAAAGAATGYPAPGEFSALLASSTPFTSGSSGAVNSPETAATQLRMVARNSYLTLTVTGTRQARDTVSELISSLAGEGAYILSSSEAAIQGSDQPAIFMQLRVPVARYEEVMDRLVGMALSIDARQEQAGDVTAEYIDTQARIRELETAINRLLEIAKSAENTEDLLTVEKALSERRAEMEVYKGRAQYLSQTAALSLIQFELRPKIVYPTQTPTPIPTPVAWRPQETAQRSALVLLRDLRRFSDWLIVFGITTLPWILMVGLVGVIGYRTWKISRR